MERKTYFVDVLLPLPLPGLFTYRIPNEFDKNIDFGVRVVVPFGKSKLYSGIAIKVHSIVPQQINTKYVIDVIDNMSIISEQQFKLWEWIADYYMCSLGEVMSVALPSALKIASETRIMLHPQFDGNISTFTDKEIKVIEALSYRQAMTVDEIAKVIDIQKVIPIIKSLVEKEAILTDEEIKDPYKPKTETYISLSNLYCDDEKALYELLDSLSKAKKTEKQSDLILAFLTYARHSEKSGGNHDLSSSISKSELLKKASVSPARLNTLIEKGIFVSKEVKISRLADYDSLDNVSNIRLSEQQQIAIKGIENEFKQYNTVLLHGVTGSGKTEIYIKMINEVLAQGKQVLYLLPEIALTSQIVNRLRKYFGDRVGVYHSRFNEYERVEIWNRVLHHDKDNLSENKYQLILGARSALLLPYRNLGLIIVDEEHDTSYKQYEPAPRYHARDCAVVLANIHHAHSLLGTATPSIESYYNTEIQKYGLVELMDRFADSTLPEIWMVNILESTKQKKMTGHFSHFLLEQIKDALEKKEQIILFQNRRGFSLRMFCNSCQSMPSCIHCDVTLTYHKKSNLLKCHYCGYAIEVPVECPVCHSKDIEMKGFGTEKIEEALEELFPGTAIARMDLDTTRSKSGYQNIISDFENHKTDILVGTQMVTKGLDFDRVSVVGILNADNLISYPDFRSFERAFQIMAQVSGRSGRKQIPGKVIIQSYHPEHPAFKFVVSNDYKAMYESQILERKKFNYPPFCRLIKITLKNKEEDMVNQAGIVLVQMLRDAFPGRILGPEFPLVARIQNYYLKDIWVKISKTEILEKKKSLLKKILSEFQSIPKYKAVRIVINVDA
jgi:primosomal protein N' (replication factor Y) (superfamily II helicase)